MKKITKLIIGLSVLTMLMVCMTTAAFAGTAEDKVTVKYHAAGIDNLGVNKLYDLAPGLEVQGDLVEKYFPDVAQYEPEGVSFLDAIVASNIKVYGEEGFKDQLAIAKSAFGDFAWVDKAYGLTMLASISGKTYVNSVHDQIKDKDELAVLLYGDGDYNKTFSYFDKEEYTVAPGKPLEVAITATSYGADYPVDDAVIVTVDTRDGLAFKEMETTFKDGKATVTFDKAGTYLISAKGKVTYDGGYGSATTDYLGALAMVTVQYDEPVASKPAKPVIKTAKRVSKTKGTVTWKKAKNAKKYEVAYKMKGAKKWTTKKTAKLKITLKLKAKKAYQVKVRSINGSAKSAYSKTKTIKAK